MGGLSARLSRRPRLPAAPGPGLTQPQGQHDHPASSDQCGGGEGGVSTCRPLLAAPAPGPAHRGWAVLRGPSHTSSEARKGPPWATAVGGCWLSWDGPPEPAPGWSVLTQDSHLHSHKDSSCPAQGCPGQGGLTGVVFWAQPCPLARPRGVSWAGAGSESQGRPPGQGHVPPAPWVLGLVPPGVTHLPEDHPQVPWDRYRAHSRLPSADTGPAPAAQEPAAGWQG